MTQYITLLGEQLGHINDIFDVILGKSGLWRDKKKDSNQTPYMYVICGVRSDPGLFVIYVHFLRNTFHAFCFFPKTIYEKQTYGKGWCRKSLFSPLVNKPFLSQVTLLMSTLFETSYG